MYGLPSSTLIGKQLPKAKLYEQLAFKPRERRQVDADVNRIDIVAMLSAETMPAVGEGKERQSISLLRLTLKADACSPETLRLLGRIPRPIAFALAYGDRVRFAVCYEKRVLLSEPMAEEEATLALQGPTIDSLWLHLVAQVAGLDADGPLSLSMQLERRERLQRLKAERDKTERRMWAERQPHRRNELFDRVRQLNEQIRLID